MMASRAKREDPGHRNMVGEPAAHGPVIAKTEVATPQGGHALATLGAVASQVALITAVLYYFGWVRAEASLSYFGLDTAMVDYATPDYVLRSLNATFTPLIIAAFAGMGAFVLDQRLIRPRAERGGHRTELILRIGTALGATLAALVCIELLKPGTIPILTGFVSPLALLASIGLLAYAGHLRSLRSSQRDYSDLFARFRAAALLGLGVISSLWLVALYAQDRGSSVAQGIAADLSSRPAVTVYSSTPLAINGLGVELSRIGTEGDRYRYRYSGLRLLIAGHDKIILLPIGWRKGENAYILPEGDSLRIDIASPAR